ALSLVARSLYLFSSRASLVDLLFLRGPGPKNTSRVPRDVHGNYRAPSGLTRLNMRWPLLFEPLQGAARTRCEFRVLVRGSHQGGEETRRVGGPLRRRAIAKAGRYVPPCQQLYFQGDHSSSA